MKTIASCIFMLLSFFSRSQGLQQSTIRQVYDLHVGDTLEFKSDHRNVNGNEEIRRYTIRVIETRRDLSDSMVLEMNDKTISSIVYSNMPSWADTFVNQMIYTNLDSTILFYHVPTLGCDSNHVCHTDSAFIDSSFFNGRKMNRHLWGNPVAAEYDTIFTEGLGMTNGGFGSEDYTEEQGGFSLIYFHLVSGEEWGNPYYFRMPDGLAEIGTSQKASITPNPALSSFRVCLAGILSNQNTFFLFDGTGRIIMQKDIMSESTVLYRGNISSGMYFWSLRSEEMNIGYGKLVFE